jgi:MoxR-like ATPase
VQCHGGIDPNVLFGLSKIVNGTSSFEESEITKVMRYGGVLYWDEVNFTPARINAVWQSVADARRQVTIQDLGNMSFDLHPTCQIIATYNPGYEGTRPLNPAFKNRFATKLFFDYSREVEERLVNKMPVLLEIADRLRGAYESGDVETPVATNMLVEFQDHAIDLGAAVAEMIFVNAFAEHERAAVQKHVEHLRDRISEERNDACGGDDIIPEEDEDA